MPPLIAPDYWMNSQLSIVRFYGRIIIENTLYVIVPPENYLVRNDFRRYIASLGFKPVKKAIQRYGDRAKTHDVLKRLAKIIKVRKRAEKSKEKGYEQTTSLKEKGYEQTTSLFEDKA